jgi:hypothetical protein
MRSHPGGEMSLVVSTQCGLEAAMYMRCEEAATDTPCCIDGTNKAVRHMAIQSKQTFPGHLSF